MGMEERGPHRFDAQASSASGSWAVNYAIVTMCIGGGQGAAGLVERAAGTRSELGEGEVEGRERPGVVVRGLDHQEPEGRGQDAGRAGR